MSSIKNGTYVVRLADGTVGTILSLEHPKRGQQATVSNRDERGNLLITKGAIAEVLE